MSDDITTAEPRIRIVTICKDNPDDLLLTCKSVQNQSQSPDSHVVVDSSGPQQRSRMREISEDSGAHFVWAEPRGIYQAMLHGMHTAADEDYIWFVNATDWLASRNSVEAVKTALKASSVGSSPVWLVGRTAIAGTFPHLLRFTESGAQFVAGLRAGELGLPHSSTVVLAGAMREVGAFNGPYRISRDYEMALKLSKKFGPPKLIDSVLSVYDEGGESARHAVRNVLHKAQARLSVQPLWHLFFEPFRIARAARREILRRLVATKPREWRLRALLGWEHMESRSLSHFCQEEGSWPECCVESLLAPDQ